VVSNRDNGGKQKYTPGADGKIHIEISKKEAVFSGDFDITAYAVDNVGNERRESYDSTEFQLKAEIQRILEPHTPVFRCGESGILRVTTIGYADRLEIEFPEALLQQNPSLNLIYEYSGTSEYEQSEVIQFMIPLYLPADASYTITVRAYKDDIMLEEFPDFGVIADESILDDIRTRLR